MRTVSSYIGKELIWIQPSVFKREYFLRERESEENVATLIIRGFFKQVATANGFGGTWTFTKPSIWRRTLDITESGKTLPYAQFTTKGFGKNGVIQLPRGDRFVTTWNMWKGKYTLASESGRELVIQERVISFRRDAKVSIISESELLEKHPWTLILIYYLQLLQKQSSSH